MDRCTRQVSSLPARYPPYWRRLSSRSLDSTSCDANVPLEKIDLCGSNAMLCIDRHFAVTSAVKPDRTASDDVEWTRVTKHSVATIRDIFMTYRHTGRPLAPTISARLSVSGISLSRRPWPGRRDVPNLGGTCSRLINRVMILTMRKHSPLHRVSRMLWSQGRPLRSPSHTRGIRAEVRDS